jgi:3-deoxy-manno-octulosonate cytidylyltransferase (CMP-KDO synthetase)
VKSFIVIPARLASTRLPRKLLLRETGKSVLRHTYESASRARRPDGICIAVDDRELLEEAEAFGARAVMTSVDCASGTDRVAQAARTLPREVDVLVNVQGDEPEIAPAAIDAVLQILAEDSTLQMATLATPIRKREQLENPAVVKVVRDAAGRAMYFSRSVAPHPREWRDELLQAEPPIFLQHIGLYAYRREFLMQLATMPPSALEQIEKLEQLRVLEAGYSIGVGVIEEATRGIDTPEDYAAFVKRVGIRS